MKVLLKLAFEVVATGVLSIGAVFTLTDAAVTIMNEIDKRSDN